MPATTISPPPPVACSSSKKPWQNPAFPFLPYFPPSRREFYHRAICPRLIAKTKCFPLKFVRVSKIPFPLSSLSFLRFQVRIKPATARQGRSGPTSARTPLSRSICVRPSLPPYLRPIVTLPSYILRSMIHRGGGGGGIEGRGGSRGGSLQRFSIRDRARIGFSISVFLHFVSAVIELEMLVLCLKKPTRSAVKRCSVEKRIRFFKLPFWCYENSARTTLREPRPSLS